MSVSCKLLVTGCKLHIEIFKKKLVKLEKNNMKLNNIYPYLKLISLPSAPLSL